MWMKRAAPGPEVEAIGVDGQADARARARRAVSIVEEKRVIFLFLKQQPAASSVSLLFFQWGVVRG
jgi:hypothetical protein